MNKQEAADYLGVSTRAIERYTQKGKLSVSYEGGKTRPIAVYDEQELSQLKEELGTTVHKPAVVDANSLTTTSLDNSPVGLSELIFQLKQITEMISSFKENLLLEGDPQKITATVPIDKKLVLTLKEAQALTGFSRERLRKAIKEGQLKGKIVGNGWKIKRSDLDAYIEVF